MRDILLQLAPPVAASLLYAALAFHFWQTRWQTPGRGAASGSTHRGDRLLPLAPLALHGIGLVNSLFGAGRMHFSSSLALSLMLWLAVLIYCLENFRATTDGLQPMILSLAALCSALPVIFPQVHIIAHAGTTVFLLHFMTAMLAHSLFTMSALHAIFIGLIEQRLHQKKLNALLTRLPPILTLESMLFRMLAVAFGLLTVALASGIMFSEAIFGKPFTLTHKTLFAFASWGIYAALLSGRHIFGWRGRIARRWTLTGFVLLFLAYIGSRFVLEFLLGRI